MILTRYWNASKYRNKILNFLLSFIFTLAHNEAVKWQTKTRYTTIPCLRQGRVNILTRSESYCLKLLANLTLCLQYKYLSPIIHDCIDHTVHSQSYIYNYVRLMVKHILFINRSSLQYTVPFSRKSSHQNQDHFHNRRRKVVHTQTERALIHSANKLKRQACWG